MGTPADLIAEHTAGRIEQRMDALKRRIHELEGPADQFEALFGRKLDYESLCKIAEVTRQAVSVCNRWKKCEATHETFDALDELCRAVRAMEGK